MIKELSIDLEAYSDVDISKCRAYKYAESDNFEENPIHNNLNPSSWKCTMIWSAYMGLPLSLEGVGAVLKLHDQKMKEGKDLIKYFCYP